MTRHWSEAWGLSIWRLGGEGDNLLFEAQTTLQREIDPKVLSPADRLAKVSENVSFVLDVLAEPKLFLVGSQPDLEQLTCGVSAFAASVG
jgi:hypothetical protein